MEHVLDIMHITRIVQVKYSNNLDYLYGIGG